MHHFLFTAFAKNISAKVPFCLLISGELLSLITDQSMERFLRIVCIESDLLQTQLSLVGRADTRIKNSARGTMLSGAWLDFANECESNDMHTRVTAIFQTVQLDRKCAVVHGNNCNFLRHTKRAWEMQSLWHRNTCTSHWNLALNWNDISFREVLSAVQFTALILARSVRPVRRSRNATKKGQTLSFFV